METLQIGRWCSQIARLDQVALKPREKLNYWLKPTESISLSQFVEAFKVIKLSKSSSCLRLFEIFNVLKFSKLPISNSHAGNLTTIRRQSLPPTCTPFFPRCFSCYKKAPVDNCNKASVRKNLLLHLISARCSLFCASQGVQGPQSGYMLILAKGGAG